MVTALFGSYWMYDTVDERIDETFGSHIVMRPSENEWRYGMIGLVLDERDVNMSGSSYPYIKVLTSEGSVGWIYEMWSSPVK